MEDRGLDTARWAIRLVERFVYRELSTAVSDDAVRAARDLQRQTVGLRRMLDKYGPAGRTAIAAPRGNMEG